jgi:hypothetical protein
VVREGKNATGRVLGAVVGSVGRGILRNAFRKTVEAVEARNSGTPQS